MFSTLFAGTIVHNQFFFTITTTLLVRVMNQTTVCVCVWVFCRHSRNACYLFIMSCSWNTSQINVYVNHVQKMCVQIWHEFPYSSPTNWFCWCFMDISCVPCIAVHSQFSLCSVNIYQSLSVISVGDTLMFYSDGNTLAEEMPCVSVCERGCVRWQKAEAQSGT